MDVAEKMDNWRVFRILLSPSTQIVGPLLSTHPSNLIIHNHLIFQQHQQYYDSVKSSTMKMKAADFFKISTVNRLKLNLIVYIPSGFHSQSLSIIRFQSQAMKVPKLKSKLTIICAFSSQEAFKGPTLEDDICSNLLNNGTRGALVPDDTTLKKEMQGYKLHSHTSYSVKQRSEVTDPLPAVLLTNLVGM